MLIKADNEREARLAKKAAAFDKNSDADKEDTLTPEQLEAQKAKEKAAQLKKRAEMRKNLMLPSTVSKKLENLGNKLPWEKSDAKKDDVEVKTTET